MKLLPLATCLMALPFAAQQRLASERPKGVGFSDGFGVIGLDGTVTSWAEFDDGSGTKIYAGGSFLFAGAERVSGLARWDGSDWEAVPLPGGAGVGDLVVHDDGNGERLFATIDGGVGAWDGATWTTWSTSSFAGTLESTAERLYVGGDFTVIDGVPANHVAVWDGETWSAMGGGLPRRAVDLCFSRAEGTPKLYAGALSGGFPSAQTVFKWTGTEWIGIPGMNGENVQALAEWNGPNGPELAIGGVGPLRSLSPSGLRELGSTPPKTIFSLRSWNYQEEEGLLVGGNFLASFGIESLAFWNGSTYLTLPETQGHQMRPVESLFVSDLTGIEELYISAVFAEIGGVVANNVARWSPSTDWNALPNTSAQQAVLGNVRAFAEFDDGSGPALFVGGIFNYAGDTLADGLAKWNGTSWEAVPGQRFSSDLTITAMTCWDDGNGPALFVATTERFLNTPPGGIPFLHRWDGTNWTELARHTAVGFPFKGITCFEVFGDAGSEALYFGGQFTEVDGVSLGGIGRWDGLAISQVGTANASSFEINALATFDDGSGPRLYAGGNFTDLNIGVPASHLASWDGVAWSPMQSQPDDYVATLEVVGAPVMNEPNLIVGGGFRDVGAMTFFRGLGRFDGTTWHRLGTTQQSWKTWDLETWNDGRGPRLYGLFTPATGAQALLRVLTPAGVWRDLRVLNSSFGQLFASNLEPNKPALWLTGSTYRIDSNGEFVLKQTGIGQVTGIKKPKVPVLNETFELRR